MGCDQVLGPKMASLHVRIMKSDLPERWPAQSSAPYSSAIPDVQILDTTRRRKWTTDSLARRALPAARHARRIRFCRVPFNRRREYSTD